MSTYTASDAGAAFVTVLGARTYGFIDVWHSSNFS